MKKNKLLILFALLLSAFTNVNAQTWTVYVTDNCTGQPVPNLTIGFLGSNGINAAFTQWVATDVNGMVQYYGTYNGYPLSGNLQVPTSVTYSISSPASSHPDRSWSAGVEGNKTSYITINYPTNSGMLFNGVGLSMSTPTFANSCGAIGITTTTAPLHKIQQHNITIYNSNSSAATGTVYGTSGWVSGAPPSSVDLKQSPYFGTSPVAGYYIVSTRFQYCGETVERKTWVQVGLPATTPNFNLNSGAASSYPFATPLTLFRCEGLMWYNTSTATNAQNWELRTWIVNPTTGVPITTVGSGMSGSGAPPSSIDLKTSSFFTTFPNQATYKVILKITYCGAGTLEQSAFVRFNNAPTPTISGFTVGGTSSTTVPANVYRCSTPNLPLVATASGIVSYTVTVSKGTYNIGTGVFGVTTSSSLNYPSATSIATQNLLSTFSTFLSGYSGHLLVRVQAYNICGASTISTVHVDLQNATNLSGASFNVNGLTPTVPVPSPLLYVCPSPSLKLNSSYSGTSTWYDITIEKGTLSGSTWTTTIPTGSNTASASYQVALPATVDLMTLTAFSSFLTGYNGQIRISLGVNGPCNSLAPIRQVYSVQQAAPSVSFNMKGAGSNPDQAAHQSTTFASLPVTTGFIAPNSPGWLGASTVAVQGYTTVSSTAVTGFNISVKHVDANGDPIGTTPTIVNFSDVGSLSSTTSYPLNFLAGLGGGGGFDWFKNNYSTIKGSYIFKATVTVATAECGDISNYSYFKIIDGTYGVYFRTTSLTEEELKNEISVYPNPASSVLNVSMHKNSDPGAIRIFNITGQLVKEQTITDDLTTIDISTLANGNYIYKVNNGSADNVGKFVKQ